MCPQAIYSSSFALRFLTFKIKIMRIKIRCSAEKNPLVLCWWLLGKLGCCIPYMPQAFLGICLYLLWSLSLNKYAVLFTSLLFEHHWQFTEGPLHTALLILTVPLALFIRQGPWCSWHSCDGHTGLLRGFPQTDAQGRSDVCFLDLASSPPPGRGARYILYRNTNIFLLATLV